uniref:phosphoribosylaminoimidazole carboxylase n=1 Tax=Phaeomonas parva TaxID=124430 RepID=A0A7S1TYZ0_9STRA|mmetsp:Transcript_22022/g.67618  ORF Transcript_22022/g.67618 Transcript_22022/m.67618 type:complete len:260 (+) Transcript_22022:191-970(+)
MAWARAAGAGLRPHLRRSLPRRSLLRPLCASSGGRGGGDALEIVGEFARLDHGRTGRTGFPEAVFSEGKTPQQVAEIFERMVARLGDGGDYPAVLATRASPEAYAAVKARGACPDAAYLPESRLILYPPSVADAMRRGEGAAPAGGAGRGDDEAGHVALCAAGTSDLPVCEEAAAVLAACGVRVSRFYDVGVAGVHRLLRVMPQIREARTLALTLTLTLIFFSLRARFRVRPRLRLGFMESPLRPHRGARGGARRCAGS